MKRRIIPKQLLTLVFISFCNNATACDGKEDEGELSKSWVLIDDLKPVEETPSKKDTTPYVMPTAVVTLLKRQNLVRESNEKKEYRLEVEHQKIIQALTAREIEDRRRDNSSITMAESRGRDRLNINVYSNNFI